MLICGFEKFDNFYVRIDILERLFLKIIETDKNNSNEIKLTADMLNLLGCSKAVSYTHLTLPTTPYV